MSQVSVMFQKIIPTAEYLWSVLKV